MTSEWATAGLVLLLLVCGMVALSRCYHRPTREMLDEVQSEGVTLPGMTYEVRPDGCTLHVAGQRIELNRDGTPKQAGLVSGWRQVNEAWPATPCEGER